MISILTIGAVIVYALVLACFALAILRNLLRQDRDEPAGADLSYLDTKTRILCEAQGELLKARIRQRVTQPELARRMNTSWSAVSRHEHGWTPTIDWLFSYAEALDVELEIKIKEKLPWLR